MSTADYIRVEYAEPHVARGRQILSAHPELRALAGPRASSAMWIVVLVAAQVAMAVALGPQSWHIWLPLAYVAGATIDHALWVLIHECSHNLIFSARLGNRAAALTANLPLVSFNVGFHNEHHDLVTVPWAQLPRIRAGAPEFYDRLRSHRSWTGLLVAFLRDREMTLFSRIVRPLRGERAHEP